jgi:hypothetical protein
LVVREVAVDARSRPRPLLPTSVLVSAAVADVALALVSAAVTDVALAVIRGTVT